jgi:hypothetical protein
MCRNQYTEQTVEEVEVHATTLAPLHAEEEVGVFDHEVAVAEQVTEEMVEITRIKPLE